MSRTKHHPSSAEAHGYHNRAFVGAFNKGMEARRRRKPLKSCPYQLILRPDGRVSFSNGYAAAWRAGWSVAAA